MKLSNTQLNRIKNKYGEWAAITGASSGIGLALSKQLAKAGLHLIINARNKSALDGLANELKQKYHIKVETVPADISESQGIEQFIRATQGKKIGLFIPSAGFGTSGLYHKSSLQEELNMLHVNVESVLSLTHYFSQVFVQQARGGIVFLSSIVAFQGVPYAANYSATKAYIQTFAEALARELKSHHVDVIAAAPGPVKSGFGKRANMKMGRTLHPDKLAAPILNALGRKNSVVPGGLSKLLSYSLRTVPRWAKIRIMESVMSGFTKHQRVIA